ncbi:MAG: hypothetical protein K5912_02395 [Alphaproteobacteria bacterium]|nr:hypothetical protein [Alphaproteobacteria bacterium]
MNKIPFLIGNFFACFVPGSERRSACRGKVNIFFFRFKIAGFIKRVYGEKLHTVKFVRQHTLNRVVCLVNDKYYVKIFRTVSLEQLNNFAFLVNYVRPYISVQIPNIIVDKKIPMYVCEKLDGIGIESFDSKFVLKNEKKFLNQVLKIIKELQSVDVDKIPDNKRFESSMQPRRLDYPEQGMHKVLGHFDLNETNFLFDKDFNIVAVLDWDALSIANNQETDKNIFIKFWNRYKKRVS